MGRALGSNPAVYSRLQWQPWLPFSGVRASFSPYTCRGDREGSSNVQGSPEATSGRTREDLQWAASLAPSKLGRCLDHLDF